MKNFYSAVIYWCLLSPLLRVCTTSEASYVVWGVVLAGVRA
jgi:hypothetical protein